MINHNKFTHSQTCFSAPLFEYKWMTWQSQISILFAETDRQRGRGRADGQDWQKNLTPNANIAPCCFCDLRRFWLFSLFRPLREKRPSRRMMLVGFCFFFLSRVKKKTKPICAQAVLQTSVVQSKTKMIYLFIPVSLEVCSFAFWTSSSCDLVDGRRWEWWTWTLMPLCFEGRCQNIWWGCLARTKRRRACNEREAHAVDCRFLLRGGKWSIIQKECCKVVVVQSSTLATQLTTLQSLLFVSWHDTASLNLGGEKAALQIARHV